MLKEKAVAYFKVVFHHFLRLTEEDHKKLVRIIDLRAETGTTDPQLQVRSVIPCTEAFDPNFKEQL
jgi:hypothetical protein